MRSLRGAARAHTPRTFAAATAATVLLIGCTVTDGSGLRFSSADAAEVFDASTVHTIDVELDQDEFAEMVATYEESGDKDWITATVTIDGEEFEDVGMRLKGNSSLRSVSADAEPSRWTCSSRPAWPPSVPSLPGSR